MRFILGLDFGGTKLAAGLVDPASGEVVASVRCPTPAGPAPDGLAAMLDLAQSLLLACSSLMPAQAGSPGALLGVGVSFGGPVEADGRTVRRSMHVAGWEQFALAEQLERVFGAPAVLANDADAAALAEYHFGAGRGSRHMLFLTVSTGIGGGVIVDGRLHRGAHAWAGEIGHMPLLPGGPPCSCGRAGCLESLSSGLSVARAARAVLEVPPPAASSLALLPADQLSARDVAVAAAAGDALAVQVWDAAIGWLGLGIAAAANLLDPSCVVVGGGLTRAGALLFDPLRRSFAAHALVPDLPILPAALGDDVGIIGGAGLLLSERAAQPYP